MKHKYVFIGITFLSALLIAGCGLLGSDDENGNEENGEEISLEDLPGTLVFSALTDDGNFQIFTMKPDGSELTQLTFREFEGDPHEDTRGFNGYMPSWRPDGEQIVFSTEYNSTTAGPALWVMNADGSDPRPLHVPDPENHPSFALPGNNVRWSPDGSKIAYWQCLSCSVSTNHVIFVFDLETEELTRLTEEPPGYQSSVPRWSPDGTRIIFSANRDYVDAETDRFRRDLYVMDADGSSQIRVTDSGFPGGYTWMGSDKIIQSVTDRNTNLKSVFIRDIESGETTTIMENLEIKNQFWVFWDNNNQLLLTVNRNHEELPVVVAAYDLNGRVLYQEQLNTQILQTGLGYDWLLLSDN